MTTTIESPIETPIDEERLGSFAGRMIEAAVASAELTTIELGRDLGLYAALRTAPLSPIELAEAAGIHPRYAREWLEQQAVAGILDVALDGDADARRYALPAEHAIALLDEESLAYVGAVAGLPDAIARVASPLRDAFRTGGGVPFAAYEIHDLQAAFNRPAFSNLLASEWLPTIPGLVERLRQDGAEAAEVGCGEGWAAIALAHAFPSLRVLAIDTDEASIAAARRHAAHAGVQDRVRFEVCDASDRLEDSDKGRFDLVCAFEMLHDVSNPVGVLRSMKEAAKHDGVVFVMDERTAEEFTAPGDLIERFLYAASVVHCLPCGMAEQPSAGTGTVMRPATLRAYGHDAGFATVDVLPIEHDMFRFYSLH
jgi:2-polyprenyl-3-methyl-5-hydroxy-6-metoxy-1,4-benzoquinol methylase